MKQNSNTTVTALLYFLSGGMLAAGNIMPWLGPLFYPGIFIASLMIFKGRVQRAYMYFFLAPYFLTLGIFVWNEVFPYFSGIMLAVLLGELFARILSLYLRRYWDKALGFLVFPAFLFMFEFLFQNIPFISFIHMIPIFSPLSRVTFALCAASFYGGRIVLFLSAAALCAAAKIVIYPLSFKKYGAIFLAGTLLLVLPSFIKLSDPNSDRNEITAACVQGSYSAAASDTAEDPYEQRFRYYMKIAEGTGADITVFPEITLGLYDIKNKADGKYREFISDAAEKTGGLTVLVLTEGNSETKSKDERYISAILADRDGIIGITRKRNLVPFSEASRYSRGMSYDVYEAGQVKAGISICYDISSLTVEKLKRNGAEIILAPFNDSGFGPVYHNIHRSLPVIKAAECAVPIAAANEDGISQIIDKDGRVLAELGFKEKGIIKSSVSLGDRLSVYLMYGKYLEWAVFAATGMLAALSFAQRLYRGIKKTAETSGR
jgi:apolipoprotein N-acyltransferase